MELQSGVFPKKSDRDPPSEALQSLVPRILVIDDEPAVRDQLRRLYEQSGYKVETAESAERALKRLAEGPIDFVITDIKLPGMSGAELIASMHESHPDIPVIAITGYLDIETAVKVLKCGAVDFVVKPFDMTAVRDATAAALERTRVYMEIRHLRRELTNGAEFGNMLSKTPEMHRLFETIRMVAATDMTVLIEGENGTGQDLLASAVHYHSARRDGPLVTVNCAGVPDAVLEQELFGHDHGGYSATAQPGKIELAHGGTLFLEEIDSLSIALQGKLLSVMEERRIQRPPDRSAAAVDVRVITATSAPLKRLVTEGKMRSDFYYRITVIPIRLMPLRQRSVDIPLLVQDFLHRHPVAAQRRITSVSKQVMRSLLDYSWPGNIPELQNVLERAIVLTTGRVIEKVDIPKTAWENQPPELGSTTLARWLDQQEKQFLAQKLEQFGGNINVTASSCGIALRSLHRKMQKYGLDKKRFKRKNGHLNDRPAANA
ncbi:MAG TPA: sigma-54 dependent transcriptional regulator [Candidatus Binatia bacterium]|nr:sigma-54 dependent transcriptional regulator [Candidatus Binatia bacterium]